jgi:hypothetical protein
MVQHAPTWQMIMPVFVWMDSMGKIANMVSYLLSLGELSLLVTARIGITSSRQRVNFHSPLLTPHQ